MKQLFKVETGKIPKERAKEFFLSYTFAKIACEGMGMGIGKPSPLLYSVNTV
jgi:hypothetical protein